MRHVTLRLSFTSLSLLAGLAACDRAVLSELVEARGSAREQIEARGSAREQSLDAKPGATPAASAVVTTPPATRPVIRAAESTAATHAPHLLPIGKPSRAQEIAILDGTLRSGSATGQRDRNPAREADNVPLALASFAIDALPYPNDPELPPRSGVSKPEAEKLCAEAGKRLCSELEWERACKGATDAEYPSANAFEASTCAAEATRCHSDLGVFALGTLGREWTASAARDGDWDRMRNTVVRGAAKDAPAPLHRCAARDAAAAESRSESLLFRCCRGAPQTAEYPSQPELPAFRPLDLDNDDVREKLRAMPETTALAPSFRLHAAKNLLSALALAGRSSQSLAPWQAATPAFAWSPVRGEELVILSGDSRDGAMVVAYYPSPDGPQFAGSYISKDEHAPILVAYKNDTRDELLYSTCWGCGGEGGALRLDGSARLRFMPR